jgi:HSP20 family protein
MIYFSTKIGAMSIQMYPQPNIIEADDHFDIELAAPGNKKADFKIELDEGVLTISSETEIKSTEKESSFTRKGIWL